MSNSGSKPIVARDRKGREVQYQTRGGPFGTGAGSTVYQATRLSGEEQASADESRLVAVKIVQVPKWKGHLADEARILDELQRRADDIVARSRGTVYRPIRIHSGPTPLKVVDNYDSELIELEYLDGQTLQQWFESTWIRGAGPEPAAIVDEVLLIARQLAEALVQIQCGPGGALIHRDIKPENVMRTSRGLRLLDFNVAKEDRESTKTQYVGTIGYMAPEVQESHHYDARADLYSVGLILWEVAHRRHFDQQLHTRKIGGKLHLAWPTTAVSSWPEAERKVLDELLPPLICDASTRLPSAESLLELVDRLSNPRRTAHPTKDPLAGLDMIELLSELRPSGLVAVVTDTSGKVPGQVLQNFLRDRMQVADPLEEWLHRELVEAATRDAVRPTLFVLAGNAGDGKSHLLFRLLRRRLADRPDVRERIRAIADATHALSPEMSQLDRLADFFAPFADENPTPEQRIHIIAMNTGMVIRFFEDEKGARFRGLYRELQRQLGLRRAEGGEGSTPWRVEVINLDLRSLLAPGPNRAPSFVERMLDRLDPKNPDGIVGPKWAACHSCSAFALCPVAFNLQALGQPHPRQALLQILRRVSLDVDVHLSPRNMWGFFYRLITGGTERYVGLRRKPDDGPCDVVRAQVDGGESAGEWLLAGQFTELLFQQPHAGSPWTGLQRHDPAFSSAPKIDKLHTRLSIKTELDHAPEIVEQLGGSKQALAGLQLDLLTSRLPSTPAFKGRRRDAAVRRQVLFHPETFRAWADADGGGDFVKLLEAYDEYGRNYPVIGKLASGTRERLMQLRTLVQDVFLHGNGRVVADVPYLRVSQPNVRSRSELLVRADYATLKEAFNVQKIVAPDVHILAHAGRTQLLDLLGYRPTQVTLDILGIRLTIDLALYEFLRRVNDGQKPSIRALSQFQALLLLGERVGNALASNQRTKELYVWDGQLHQLALDDFGHPTLHAVH